MCINWLIKSGQADRNKNQAENFNVYYKNKQYKEALEILQSALINTKNNEGLIAPFTELLNNCINMHQLYQDDIKDCFSKKGKYS